MPPALWYKDAIALATVVIATATVVNLFVSIFLWRATAGATRITRDIFEASHRPYLGVTQIDTELDAANQRMKIVCHARNFGSIPAHNVEIIKGQNLINGVPVKYPHPTKFGKFSVFPGAPHFLNFFLRGPHPLATLPTANLELHVTLRYEGLNGKGYRYHQESMYHPETGQFVPLKEVSSEE